MELYHLTMSIIWYHGGQLESERDRVRYLLVSYADDLSRRLCHEFILPFSPRMAIGSVIMIYSISLDTITYFAIHYI